MTGREASRPPETDDDGEKLISVLIPTYNMAGYLKGAVESVTEGSYDNVEVLVIDDGSTDETPELMRRLIRRDRERGCRKIRFARQTNQGKSAAMNRALELAEGSFVAMLDADDELPENSLSIRAEALAGDGSTDVVIGAFEVFDEGTVYGTRPAPVTNQPEVLHRRFYMGLKTPFHLNACLIRRGVAEKVGGFDETLERCVDGDYALRMLQAASTVETVDRVVYRYRKHRASAGTRLRYRLKTARDRPQVVWKNYSGVHRWVAVGFAVVMDAAKMIYEVFGIFSP